MGDRREAARRIRDLGPKIVVIKGGHDEGEDGQVGWSSDTRENFEYNENSEDGANCGSGQVVDLVYDGTVFTELTGERVHTVHTHGTGCTFSAAITAGLAKGMSPLVAIANARAFIQAAIEDGLYLGAGYGPTNHWAYGCRRQEVLR